MRERSTITLPYEPNYTGHWRAAKRREETRRWLAHRERQLVGKGVRAPSIVPDEDDDEPAPVRQHEGLN
jgi:hypothetical protein